MRVGIVLFNIPLSQTSGSCRFVNGLARALKKQRWDVSIFANKSYKRRQEIIALKKVRIDVCEIQSDSLGSWAGVVNEKNQDLLWEIVKKFTEAILNEHRKKPIDVLHIQHIVGSTLVGSLVKFITRIPVVATCHGSETYELRNANYNFAFKPAIHCDAISCVSDHLEKQVEDMLDFSKTLCMVKVVMPGLDNIFKYDTKVKRDRTVLFVGRLIPEKGIQEAIEAFLLATSIPSLNDYKMIIAGEGYLLNELKKDYKELIKKGRIVFVGSVTQQKISHLMQKSSVLLFASVWDEPFGMVITEALASGLPVIANDVGYAKKLISDGGYVAKRGNWKQFTNLLQRHLKQGIDVRRMRVVAKKCSKQYKWSNIAKQFIEIYESVQS